MRKNYLDFVLFMKALLEEFKQKLSEDVRARSDWLPAVVVSLPLYIFFVFIRYAVEKLINK